MAVKSLIETVTVGAGGVASIEFTGIDGTGQDLVLLVSARYSNNSSAGDVTINGDTGNTAYSSMRLQGNGSAVSTAFFPIGDLPNLLGVGNADNATANTFGNTEMTFSNYTSSEYKSVSINGVSENNATTAFALMYAGVWQNTSAITSIKWSATAGQTLVQYSTASLYKIKYD